MGRVIALLYGLVAYVAFAATIVYAIGFVTGLVVPKTIDSGPAGPPMQAIIINLLLMSLFAVQHSVMARPQFKKWWTRIVPVAVERSTFVLFSSLALGFCSGSGSRSPPWSGRSPIRKSQPHCWG